MDTPAITMLADIEGSLIGAMTTAPLALMVVYVILRKAPRFSEWAASLVLWAIGIVIGIAFSKDGEWHQAMVTGFIQGTLSVGIALAYAAGMRSFLKDNKDGS